MQDTKLQDSYCFVRSISAVGAWTEAAVSKNAQNSLIAGLVDNGELKLRVSTSLSNQFWDKFSLVCVTFVCLANQWRNDGVAAASSDGGPHWW